MLNFIKSLLFPAFIFLFAACQEPASQSQSKDSDPPQAPSEVQGHAFSRVDSLSALLEKDPDNQAAFLARAEYYLSKNDFRRAGVDLYNAEQINPAEPRIYELKGRQLLAENKSRQAREIWQKCAKDFPQSIGCRNELAKLYLAVSDYKQALELLNQSISIDNKNAESYYLKGLVVRDFYNDTSLALQYFQNAVDLRQDYLEALDMMGVMLASRGDTLAKYYYQRVLDQDPNRQDIYYKLGVFYMDREDWNRALENYSKALQMNPRDADSYFNMGFIHIQLQQYAKARDLFTNAINSRTQNYKAYYGRGYSHEMLGDVINARKDYRAALKANPIYAPAEEALGRVNRTMRGQE